MHARINASCMWLPKPSAGLQAFKQNTQTHCAHVSGNDYRRVCWSRAQMAPPVICWVFKIHCVLNLHSTLVSPDAGRNTVPLFKTLEVTMLNGLVHGGMCRQFGIHLLIASSLKVISRTIYSMLCLPFRFLLIHHILLHALHFGIQQQNLNTFVSRCQPVPSVHAQVGLGKVEG